VFKEHNGTFNLFVFSNSLLPYYNAAARKSTSLQRFFLQVTNSLLSIQYCIQSLQLHKELRCLLCRKQWIEHNV